MKEKKQQPTTSKKLSHNTLDWVEKELRDAVPFDLDIDQGLKDYKLKLGRSY